MQRVLITADLHVESSGLETIRRLVAGIVRESPDLVILAGDLGNPLVLFEECLACFLKVGCPIAVLAGNHDVWCSAEERSADLFRRRLPQVTREFGFHWLEDGPIRLDDGVAVAGSIGWYDYSARDPRLNQNTQDIIANKARYAMDALRVDWSHNDIEFAAECRDRLHEHLCELEEDPTVREVLVVTHVPMFEEQLERRVNDRNWSEGTPYFGHHTMGEMVRRHRKVRYVVSGHTHNGVNGVVDRDAMQPIGVAVVPSDYGRPRWILRDFG